MKIFYTGEFYEPNLSIADLSISFSKVNDIRNYRYPLYSLYFDLKKLLNKPDAETIFLQKKKFCCFVVSNENCPTRNKFFHQLSRYKKVDSRGKYLNNIGAPVKDKKTFISDYKFVLSFENKSYPGYVTEKIVEPMIVNSIPIYWGDPYINNDFNSKSFVNINDFKSIKQAINYIIELDNDDRLYKKLMTEPWFTNNQLNENYLPENLLFKLVNMIENRGNRNEVNLELPNVMALFYDSIKRKLRGERKYY